MIPGIDYETGFTRKGVFMESYYMGIDVSKGYADFVILDAEKNVVEPNFQLDDTFSSHCKLFEILKRFFESHSEAVLFAAVESTCLLYTSDAADDLLCVDLGGRRIIK